MKKLLLASAALLAIAAAPPVAPIFPGHPSAPSSAPEQAGPQQPRYPGFGAVLANAPAIASPGAWTVVPRSDSWEAIANSTAATRQQARWNYAKSLIGSELAGEAIGVLDVMVADDPDLGFVPSYGVARGATLAMLQRDEEAITALSLGELVHNPEACAWRMLALAHSHQDDEALRQIGCALPALKARDVAARTPFILATAASAIAAGQPELALRWLSQLPESNATANLIRARASFALGKAPEGRLRLQQVMQNGDREQKADAQVALLEAAATSTGVPAKSALKQLDEIAYDWRGGEIEERALRLSYRLAAKTHDLRASLDAGATLFRYFRLRPEDGSLLSDLQGSLLAALAPDSKLPVDQAAGLYWDYRDLTPAGAAGDYLVSRLADRLQGAGLYGRAAELLEHQLLERTTDIAQGPLSARVATLHILSGRPDRAIDVLRKTDAVPYPADMLAARHRVEAVALTQLGKSSEALAILQAVPDGAALKAEIYWRNHDWAGLATTAEAGLPAPERLSDVAQTVLLRQAIALAMLGREPALAKLRARYNPAFAKLPSANLFDLLTRPAGTIDPDLLGKAMAGLPAASPAGELADLLDTDPIKASS